MKKEKYVKQRNTRQICRHRKIFSVRFRKETIMDMVYKYKDACNLIDEIGTCPNTEVEIDVRDKSPFFIKSYYVKEKDKNVLDKERKRSCYLGILKEGF